MEQQRDLWDKVLLGRYAVGVFLATFATLWCLAEPLGLPLGFGLWTQLALWSTAGATLWILVSRLHSVQVRLRQREAEVASLKSRLAEAGARRSFCGVVNRETRVCPLGVVAIHSKTEDTLRSSLTDAKHTFRWLGMSAFNVVHNNRDLFEQQKHVDFEFVIVAPENAQLIAQLDQYYMATQGTLRSGKLIADSSSLLKEIAASVHHKVQLRYHNQMPTFRIVLIDDHKALVSFYERGTDALRSHQIEIVESPEATYCILKWFQMFYEKALLTETLSKPPGGP